METNVYAKYQLVICYGGWKMLYGKHISGYSDAAKAANTQLRRCIANWEKGNRRGAKPTVEVYKHISTSQQFD